MPPNERRTGKCYFETTALLRSEVQLGFAQVNEKIGTLAGSIVASSAISTCFSVMFRA
jgi:hypothetical protein